jgi:hypothetical protein
MATEKNTSPEVDPGLKVILFTVLLGVITIIIVGIWMSNGSADASLGAILGLSMLVSLASALVGGFLGFLFGIPKSLQKGNEMVLATATNGNPTKERPYSNNTNLEQISDWLTKIIVGVSLTQIPAILRHFDMLTTKIALGFKPLDETFAYPYSASLIIFYSICGFLAVYIYAKIYLLKQLTFLEDSLDRRNLQNEVTKQVSNKLEISRLENIVTEFNRVKYRLLRAENDPDYKEIVEMAQPGPVKYVDDSQKGRWGGQSESAQYKLEALFTKSTTTDTFTIKVSLVAKENNVLTGAVYFLLHDAFNPGIIKKSIAENNIASIEINSYEAFTVGVIFNDGDKLEIDLNMAPNCPTEYKYSGKLLTIDEVNEELKKMEGGG